MTAGKFLKYLIFVVVTANIAIVAYVFLGAATPKPKPMPNPNGYDDFVKGGTLLIGDISGSVNMNTNELEALVATNGSALKLLRSGLTKECRVPDDYSAAYVSNMIPTSSAFHKSAILFYAEGQVAEAKGHTNDAATIYLDGIRFSQESSRGSVLIGKLVGIACESIALSPLTLLSKNLDAKQCREVARQLEEIDVKAEPIEETLAHEKAYSRHTGGALEPVEELFFYRQIRDSKKKCVDGINTSDRSRRKAMIKFAARAYELENGKPPANITDLVPAYLKTIPKDPATGLNLTLSP